MRKRRADGTLAERVPAYRRMMPYIMTGKNTSAVYFKTTIDMENALEFLENPPRELEGLLTPTVLFLRAASKVLHEFPRLNRFVSGRRLYQRDGVYISFSAKKAFSEDAPIVVIKMRFDHNESFVQMARRVHEELQRGRSDEPSYTDRETAFLLKLPRSALRFVVWLQSVLDYFGLLPKRFIETDLFYASAFVANLGSIGLDAVYHHLYEYGNIPIFATIGRIQPMLAVRDGEVVVRRMVELKITFDERIEDGFYAAKAIARLKELMENPHELL